MELNVELKLISLTPQHYQDLVDSHSTRDSELP